MQLRREKLINTDPPVVGKHGSVENYLLQQLDEFIREVGRHESFDSNRYFIWVLGFTQSCLDDLRIMLQHVICNVVGFVT